MANDRETGVEGRAPATPGPEHPRDPEEIRSYHAMLGDPPQAVDPTTWLDLALDAVFARFDRTDSQLGSQVLYRQLRVLESDPSVLRGRTQQYAVFQRERAWVEQARALLRRLRHRQAAWLAPLILGGIPDPPRHPWALRLCALAPLACFLGCLIWPKLLLPGLALMLLNIAINELLGPGITGYFPVLAQLHILMGVAQAIARMEPHGLPQLEFLRKRRTVMREVRACLGTLAIDRTRLTELPAALHGYLNLFFLFDIVAFQRAIPVLRRHQQDLAAILEALGSLDTGISVAATVQDLPAAHCTPVITGERFLRLRGAWHPLLPAPVGNDLEIRARPALISGSNMAGKTTFLRTVGINLILGQTLQVCLAEEALIPAAEVHSCIHSRDRMEAGMSAHFVELRRLLEFIQGAGGQPRLLIIDEIFRGTNAVERIAAAIAVLRHLGRDRLVLVSSHDLELGEGLAADYDLYHFSEQVAAAGCAFDYRLRPGPATSGNAIRLMERQGYPEAITQEARRLAEHGPGAPGPSRAPRLWTPPAAPSRCPPNP